MAEEEAPFITLDDLLLAPKLPANVPHFDIIEECLLSGGVRKGVSDADSDEEDAPGANGSTLSSRSTLSLVDELEAAETESQVEEVFPCECRYDSTATNKESQACGASSGCINRTLFIECNAQDCAAGAACQNMRFQKKSHANVKVVETPGKGFGLFTCEDLRAYDGGCVACI